MNILKTIKETLLIHRRRAPTRPSPQHAPHAACGKHSRFVVFPLVILVFPLLLAAQTPSASLVGRITDPSKAAIPNATIQVRNGSTNAVRSVESQANGEYTVTNLPPGEYQVTFNKPGFKELVERNLVLQVAQNARLDAQLQVGATVQQVAVTASVPLVNTESASRGGVITNQEIMQIPLDGRDFEDLAFFTPGVGPSQQHYKGSPYLMNGGRASSSNILVNGFADESPRDAGPQVQVPLDTLQEFKVQTSNYSAEYGQLGGGVVNMVLKSGGNQFHGTAFEFVRNDVFDARNFFDAGRSELRRNQFGATLGGPVKIPHVYNGRDKTFFLFGWESYRQVEGLSQLGVVPSLLERQGDFSKSLSAKGKPLVLTNPFSTKKCSKPGDPGCFSGNKIPSSLFSPAAVKLMSYYPLPNFTGPNNFLANGHDVANWDDFLFKVDQRLTSRDNLSANLVYRPSTTTDPFSGNGLGTFGATTTVGGWLIGLSETRIFAPNLINEFRASLTRTTDGEIGSHAGTNWAAQVGIPGTTTDPKLLDFPQFKLTGYEGLGDNASDPIRYTVNNYDFNDVMTWIKGKQTLLFGADLIRTQYFQPTHTNFNGEFDFKGTATGNAFADFLLGLPGSTNLRSGSVTNYLFNTDVGAFIQDNYRVRPNLTLNLGLRYEIDGAPYEKYGQLTNYDPAVGKVLIASARQVPNLNAILAEAGATGQVGLAAQYGLPFSLVNTPYNNISPRIGIAWRPFGGNRTVLRGGYGLYYTVNRLNPVRTDLAGQFPFSITQTFNAPKTDVTALTLSDPFPKSLSKFGGVNTAGGYQVSPPAGYMQSWNLTLDRDLGHGISLEAGYAASKGTHLSRKYDLNQIDPLTGLRPYSFYGDIEYYSFGANSDYNAGIVSLLKRFSKNLFFRANYTYSKSLDYASGENYAGAGGYAGAQNSLDLAAEYGPSDFNATHYFSMDAVYMPKLTGNWLLRGWEIAPTLEAYTGQPFTPVIKSNVQDLGEATRPNRLANGAISNPSPNDWFDLAAFQDIPPTAIEFGNSGRNILTGPGFVGLNFALARNFHPTEGSQLQFRWEVFNALNRANFNLPVNAIDTTTAGTITSADFGREMQFGVHFTF